MSNPHASLEAHFKPFREQTIGNDALIAGPYGEKPLLYADWIASGRLYRPVEERMTESCGPWVANTHSESTHCGQLMTQAYHDARELIKGHIGARTTDALLPSGSGMTGALCKLQRILGLKVPEQVTPKLTLKEEERPVVFITHMEHHSNHTSWLETIADTVVLPPDENLLVRVSALEEALERYRDRPLKIGSFTAASNVTGIRAPWRDLARAIHGAGGWCFVDFAANAPYDEIAMHTDDPAESADAAFFSPHKFLGGPGSAGILAFNRALYRNRVPDQPGGGTVRWTNRWNEYEYLDDVELREDGGTPAFLQTIRAALACGVKESMGIAEARESEDLLVGRALDGLAAIPKVVVLAGDQRDRIGAISFYIEGLHYNLVVRLLSDRFGVQVRGGCSCAGTYGHYLLHVDRETSHEITGQIHAGDLSHKPGWVRLSIHPMMTFAEVDFILSAIADIARHGKDWEDDYDFDHGSAEWRHTHWSTTGIKGLFAPF